MKTELQWLLIQYYYKHVLFQCKSNSLLCSQMKIVMQISVELFKNKPTTAQVMWRRPGSHIWPFNNNTTTPENHFPNTTCSAHPKSFNFRAIWGAGWVFSAITETILCLTTTPTVPNKPLGSSGTDSLRRSTTVYFPVSAGRVEQTMEVANFDKLYW